MAEPVRVFVSHHHSPEEDAFTARLVADLQAAGADVWVDTSGITSDDFVKKISEGLAGRQWLVLVMTPEALGSRWVNDEVNAALHQVNSGRMRGVIPFVMTPCDEARMPALWAQLYRYDATKGYEAARDGLLNAVGLSLAAAKDAPTSPYAGQSQNAERLDIASLKSRYNITRLITLEGLLSLTPVQFEDAAALMLAASGFSDLMRPRGDNQPDLICTDALGQLTYVWCRRYGPNLLVNASEVAEASHAVLSWDIRGLIVTTSLYSDGAKDIARSDGIKLIDGHELVIIMRHVLPK
jgi:hypothetical protein